MVMVLGLLCNVQELWHRIMQANVKEMFAKRYLMTLYYGGPYEPTRNLHGIR